MTRVSTMGFQQTLTAGIAHAQQQLQLNQTQLATGKKATDYASLGSDGVQSISARSLQARQTAYVTATTGVGNTLSLYSNSINAIDTAASTLRSQVLAALGSGQSAGLDDSLNTAFDQVRSSLNVAVDGVPLFGGSQTGVEPFRPATFSETATADPTTAFANDNVRSSARIGDGVTLQYGITASDVGTNLLAAFSTLASAGPIGTTLTDAQKTALTTAVGQIDAGLTQVRAVNAENGSRQAEVETMASRASDRESLLASTISTSEDADLGQVAIDIAQNKTVLEASYSVFSQLASLNLGLFLK